MKKAFIKMNEGKDYLSLGNLFNSIKKNSTNKLTSIQTEIFCSLFNINDISSKTVNNYCIGYRAISMDYKKIYYDYQKLYEENEMAFWNKEREIQRLFTDKSSVLFCRSNT